MRFAVLAIFTSFILGASLATQFRGSAQRLGRQESRLLRVNSAGLRTSRRRNAAHLESQEIPSSCFIDSLGDCAIALDGSTLQPGQMLRPGQCLERIVQDFMIQLCNKEEGLFLAESTKDRQGFNIIWRARAASRLPGQTSNELVAHDEPQGEHKRDLFVFTSGGDLALVRVGLNSTEINADSLNEASEKDDHTAVKWISRTSMGLTSEGEISRAKDLLQLEITEGGNLVVRRKDDPDLLVAQSRTAINTDLLAVLKDNGWPEDDPGLDDNLDGWQRLRKLRWEYSGWFLDAPSWRPELQGQEEAETWCGERSLEKCKVVADGAQFLRPGEQLPQGRALTSKSTYEVVNRHFKNIGNREIIASEAKLVMQEDGNLVLEYRGSQCEKDASGKFDDEDKREYLSCADPIAHCDCMDSPAIQERLEAEPFKVVWASGTHGKSKGPYSLVLTTPGDLMVLGEGGKTTVWKQTTGDAGPITCAALVAVRKKDDDEWANPLHMVDMAVLRLDSFHPLDYCASPEAIEVISRTSPDVVWTTVSAPSAPNDAHDGSLLRIHRARMDDPTRPFCSAMTLGNCVAPPEGSGDMVPGEAITSTANEQVTNGVISLKMQADGNLVLYVQGRAVLFASKTQDGWGKEDETPVKQEGPYSFIFSSIGELEIVDGTGRVTYYADAETLMSTLVEPDDVDWFTTLLSLSPTTIIYSTAKYGGAAWTGPEQVRIGMRPPYEFNKLVFGTQYDGNIVLRMHGTPLFETNSWDYEARDYPKGILDKQEAYGGQLARVDPRNGLDDPMFQWGRFWTQIAVELPGDIALGMLTGGASAGLKIAAKAGGAVAVATAKAAAKQAAKNALKMTVKALSKQTYKQGGKAIGRAFTKRAITTGLAAAAKGAKHLVVAGAKLAWKGLKYAVRHPLLTVWRAVKFPFQFAWKSVKNFAMTLGECFQGIRNLLFYTKNAALGKTAEHVVAKTTSKRLLAAAALDGIEVQAVQISKKMNKEAASEYKKWLVKHGKTATPVEQHEAMKHIYDSAFDNYVGQVGRKRLQKQVVDPLKRVRAEVNMNARRQSFMESRLARDPIFRNGGDGAKKLNIDHISTRVEVDSYKRQKLRVLECKKNVVCRRKRRPRHGFLQAPGVWRKLHFGQGAKLGKTGNLDLAAISEEASELLSDATKRSFMGPEDALMADIRGSIAGSDLGEAMELRRYGSMKIVDGPSYQRVDSGSFGGKPGFGSKDSLSDVTAKLRRSQTVVREETSQMLQDKAFAGMVADVQAVSRVTFELPVDPSDLRLMDFEDAMVAYGRRQAKLDELSKVMRSKELVEGLGQLTDEGRQHAAFVFASLQWEAEADAIEELVEAGTRRLVKQGMGPDEAVHAICIQNFNTLPSHVTAKVKTMRAKGTALRAMSVDARTAGVLDSVIRDGDNIMGAFKALYENPRMATEELLESLRHLDASREMATQWEMYRGGLKQGTEETEEVLRSLDAFVTATDDLHSIDSAIAAATAAERSGADGAAVATMLAGSPVTKEALAQARQGAADAAARASHAARAHFKGPDDWFKVYDLSDDLLSTKVIDGIKRDLWAGEPIVGVQAAIGKNDALLRGDGTLKDLPEWMLQDAGQLGSDVEAAMRRAHAALKKHDQVSEAAKSKFEAAVKSIDSTGPLPSQLAASEALEASNKVNQAKSLLDIHASMQAAEEGGLEAADTFMALHFGTNARRLQADLQANEALLGALSASKSLRGDLGDIGKYIDEGLLTTDGPIAMQIAADPAVQAASNKVQETYVRLEKLADAPESALDNELGHLVLLEHDLATSELTLAIANAAELSGGVASDITRAMNGVPAVDEVMRYHTNLAAALDMRLQLAENLDGARKLIAEVDGEIQRGILEGTLARQLGVSPAELPGLNAGDLKSLRAKAFGSDRQALKDFNANIADSAAATAQGKANRMPSLDELDEAIATELNVPAAPIRADDVEVRADLEFDSMPAAIQPHGVVRMDSEFQRGLSPEQLLGEVESDALVRKLVRADAAAADAVEKCAKRIGDQELDLGGVQEQLVKILRSDAKDLQKSSIARLKKELKEAHFSSQEQASAALKAAKGGPSVPISDSLGIPDSATAQKVMSVRREVDGKVMENLMPQLKEDAALALKGMSKEGREQVQRRLVKGARATTSDELLKNYPNPDAIDFTNAFGVDKVSDDFISDVVPPYKAKVDEHLAQYRELAEDEIKTNLQLRGIDADASEIARMEAMVEIEAIAKQAADDLTELRRAGATAEEVLERQADIEWGGVSVPKTDSAWVRTERKIRESAAEITDRALAKQQSVDSAFWQDVVSRRLSESCEQQARIASNYANVLDARDVLWRELGLEDFESIWRRTLPEGAAQSKLAEFAKRQQELAKLQASLELKGSNDLVHILTRAKKERIRSEIEAAETALKEISDPSSVKEAKEALRRATNDADREVAQAALKHAENEALQPVNDLVYVLRDNFRDGQTARMVEQQLSGGAWTQLSPMTRQRIIKVAQDMDAGKITRQMHVAQAKQQAMRVRDIVYADEVLAATRAAAESDKAIAANGDLIVQHIYGDGVTVESLEQSVANWKLSVQAQQAVASPELRQLMEGISVRGHQLYPSNAKLPDALGGKVVQQHVDSLRAIRDQIELMEKNWRVNPFSGRTKVSPDLKDFVEEAGKKYDELVHSAIAKLRGEEVIAQRRLGHAMADAADSTGAGDPMAILESMGMHELTGMMDDAVISTNIAGAATYGLSKDLAEKQKAFDSFLTTFDDWPDDLSPKKLSQLKADAKKVWNDGVRSNPLVQQSRIDKMYVSYGVLGRQHGIEVLNGNIAVGNLGDACKAAGLDPAASKRLSKAIKGFEKDIQPLLRSQDPNVAMGMVDGWTFPIYHLESERRYAHFLDEVATVAREQGKNPDMVLKQSFGMSYEQVKINKDSLDAAAALVRRDGIPAQFGGTLTWEEALERAGDSGLTDVAASMEKGGGRSDFMLGKLERSPLAHQAKKQLDKARAATQALEDAVYSQGQHELREAASAADDILQFAEHQYRLAMAQAAQEEGMNGADLMRYVFQTSGQTEMTKLKHQKALLEDAAARLATMDVPAGQAKQVTMALLDAADRLAKMDLPAERVDSMFRFPTANGGAVNDWTDAGDDGTTTYTLLNGFRHGAEQYTPGNRKDGDRSRSYLHFNGVPAKSLRPSPDLKCTADDLSKCVQLDGAWLGGASMQPGQYLLSQSSLITSADGGGSMRLAVVKCGVQVAYRPAGKPDFDPPLWSSKTEDKGEACAFVFTDEGDLFLVDDSGDTHFMIMGSKALREGDDPSELELKQQPDGNLVLYQKPGSVVWSSGTYGKKQGKWKSRGVWNDGAVRDASFLHCTASDRYKCQEAEDGDIWWSMRPGQILEAPWSLRSHGHGYDGYLTMQGDCNLVLYAQEREGHGRKPLWNTATDSGGHCFFLVEGSGRLVIVERGGDEKWHAATDRVGAIGELRMQDDGNVVLYRKSGASIWTTDTWDWDTDGDEEGNWQEDFEDYDNLPLAQPCDEDMPVCPQRPDSVPKNVLPIGYSLHEYDLMEAAVGENEKVTLHLQSDGNVVLRKLAISDGRELEILWASDTWDLHEDHEGPFRLAVMSTSKKLHILDKHGNSVWKHGFGLLGLQRGVLALYLEEGVGRLTMVDEDGGTRDLFDPT